MRNLFQRGTLRIGLMLAPMLFANLAHAAAVGGGCNHVTDGTFGTGEWNCATVHRTVFPQVGAAGGATLYVDQGLQAGFLDLFLMYDYTAGTTASFFDVFFEVVPDHHSYLVRIPGTGGLQAFERPIGTTAPLTANGSFDITAGSGWTPLSQADLNNAKFQGALGNGASPNSSTPHPMAEFQLTINEPNQGHVGLYDPSPAFWAASAKPGGVADPPITSAIFQLNPDGTTTVSPVLDNNGAPVQQGDIPEPATLLAFTSGLLALAGYRRLHASKH